jgi:hypothetical protein
LLGLPVDAAGRSGLQLPDTEGVTIDSASNVFVGAYRLPLDSVIPAPGLGLPAGTRLDAAMLIPRGAAFLIDSTLPAGTQLGLGYLEPPQQSPPELQYTGASTLGADTSVPSGTALLGDALIPAAVGALSGPLFLPGGTLVAQGLELPPQQRIGMLLPPTSTLSTTTFNPSNLPAETLLLGYTAPSTTALPIPVGSEFLTGYQLADGGVVQPGPAASAVSLPAGTVLLGGIALPPAASGNYFTFSADVTLPGGAMVPSDGSGQTTTQGPEGLTIPVNSQSISGTTDSQPQDVDFGAVLTQAIDMPPGALYCKIADITQATGFAKTTTATIEYLITGNAPTLVEIATDFDFTTIVQSFSPATTTGWVVEQITDLSPNTTYYFRVSLQGCQTTNTIRQGFRTTGDPCGGDFELVSAGDVYDGWDGRLGTSSESALHVSQMKINPADNRLYIATSKQSDGTANLYRSSEDFLGIAEAGLTVGNQAVRNSTAIGFQNFGSDFVYLGFKDNANRGFSLYRWDITDFNTQISIASAEGSGGAGSATKEGFGLATNVLVTDSIGGALGLNDVMYISTRTTGNLYMADSSGGTPGDALDFTNCTNCSQNNGAGELWSSGTNNIGALGYVDSGATRGLFIGVGDEGGTGATLAFMPTADLGSTSPTISTLTIAGLQGEVVTDIAVLNQDIVMSLRASGGGQAWICADYTTNDCSNGANWAMWVDFAAGTGLSEADAANTTIRWVRQMPTSGAVYLGTENASGAQIWSAVDITTSLTRAPQSGCAGLGDATLIASPTAETMHNTARNIDIVYFALHKYTLYQQANAGVANNVYVYRLLEQLP